MSGRHRLPRRSAHALPGTAASPALSGAADVVLDLVDPVPDAPAWDPPERDEKPFLPAQAVSSLAHWALTLPPAAWMGDAIRRARYSRTVQIAPVTDKDVMDGIRILRRAQERAQLPARRSR